jgi:hypothetical protein
MDEVQPTPPEKTRGHGTPPGAATIQPPHGGRIGNPGFVPTQEQRDKVRSYAKLFPLHGERLIARLVGCSRTTLRLYFADDLEQGRAEMLAAVAAQMINRALNATDPTAKGDLDAQKFVLARLGGWSTKIEVSATTPEAVADVVDLSRLTAEELDEYGRLAAIAEGIDPDGILARPIG